MEMFNHSYRFLDDAPSYSQAYSYKPNSEKVGTPDNMNKRYFMFCLVNLICKYTYIPAIQASNTTLGQIRALNEVN